MGASRRDVAEVWSRPGWFCAAGMPEMASETLMVALRFVFLGPISPLSGQLSGGRRRIAGFHWRSHAAPHRFTLDVIRAAASTPNPLQSRGCLTGPIHALEKEGSRLSSKISQSVLPSADHSIPFGQVWTCWLLFLCFRRASPRISSQSAPPALAIGEGRLCAILFCATISRMCVWCRLSRGFCFDNGTRQNVANLKSHLSASLCRDPLRARSTANYGIKLISTAQPLDNAPRPNPAALGGALPLLGPE